MKPNYGFRAALCLTLITGLTTLATAQATHRKPTAVTPLQIGDTVPDITLTSLDGKRHRLSDYRGKALVLNLMSIYCGTCVANMPGISALSDKMQDSLHIFFVVPEEKSLAQALLGRLPRVKPLLPQLIRDTVLAAVFPHRIVPHVVWLNRDRKVTAITGDREVTALNLRTLYSGEPMPIYQKTDDAPMLAGTLLLNSQAPIGTTFFYRSTLAGMVPGGECLEGLLHDSSGQQRLVSVNMTLDGMYRQTAGGLWFNHLLMELKDTTRYREDGTRAWDSSHVYTYELTMPGTVPAERLYQYMREDLDRAFGLTSRLVVQPVTAWVIERKEDGTLPPPSQATRPDLYLMPDDTIRMAHYTLAELADALNSIARIGEPIFADGTGYTTPIDLELGAPGITDMKALQRAFEKGGLRLVKKEIPLEVLVVRDKPEAAATAEIVE